MTANQRLERAIPSSQSSPFQDDEVSFQQLLDSIPGMMSQFRLAPDGTIQFRYVSAGCEALFDLHPHDLLVDASDFIKLIHSDDRASFHSSITHATHTLQAWNWEGRFQLSAQPVRWIEVASQPMLQPDGEILWNGMMMDVTRRKQAEEVLHASESKNRALLSVIPDMMFCYNRDGIYLDFFPSSDWDPAIAPETSLGKSIFEILPASVAQSLSQAIHQALDTNEIQRLEYQLESQGKRYDYEARIIAIATDRVFSIVRDISDRKLAEAELQQTKNFLESVLKTLPVGVAAKDAKDLRFVLWNSTMTDLLGISETDALGKSDYDFFPPEQADFFIKKDREVLTSKQILDIPEEEISAQTGEKRIFHTKKTAILGNDGQPQYLLAITEDITERKRAETLLAQQKRTLRAILDNAPIWIWMTDNHGKMQFVNRTFCENVGIPEERFLVANHYREVLGEEAAQNCMASDAACHAQEVPHASSEILPFVDGQLHHVEILKAKIRDEEGNLVGIMGLGVDASDRKQSEETLRNYAERQALLNQLTNQIRNSLDQDTIVETAITAIRQQLSLDFCGLIWFHADAEPPAWEIVKAVEATNLKPHSLGRHPATLVGPIEEILMVNGVVRIDDVDQFAEPIHRAYLQKIGGKSVIQVRIILQNGQLGVLAGNRQQVQPWKDQEVELLQAVAAQLAIALNQANSYAESQNRAQELAHTLAELQRTQMQMIQSEKMSSLGQLVAGVAHEINNPVNFIYGNLSHADDYIKDVLGLVDLYQQHYPKPAPEILDEIAAIDLDFLKDDLMKLLNSMKVGADRIQTIVASLRTFSRMDEAEKKSVNIHDGIDSTLMILQNRIKAKHDRAEIKISREYGKLPAIECYSGQLNQVFMNILVNAIDALEELSLNHHQATWQPTITIRTEYLSPPELTTTDNSSQPAIVRVYICDNGTGMPESVRSRIFDPFYTTKPVGKGTGMGMSISYQIITEKHGGTIVCNSTPGVGTEFVIQIPIR